MKQRTCGGRRVAIRSTSGTIGEAANPHASFPSFPSVQDMFCPTWEDAAHGAEILRSKIPRMRQAGKPDLLVWPAWYEESQQILAEFSNAPRLRRVGDGAILVRLVG